MAPKTIKRIFDPFFSTKQHGHGLGLSTTLGVIRTHHGGVYVQSQAGTGTTFTVLPPIGDVNLAEEREVELSVGPKQSNRPIVLVIDD
ncbi:hypothetical protein BH10CHL1_BH10CHL1_12780 [soil metagenome]